MVIEFDDGRQSMEFKDDLQGRFIRLSILAESRPRDMYLLSMLDDMPTSISWYRAQYIARQKLGIAFTPISWNPRLGIPTVFQHKGYWA